MGIHQILAQVPYAPDRLSEQDYSRAERSLSYMASNKVENLSIKPHWSTQHVVYFAQEGGTRSWYMVDLKSKKKSELFDHSKFASVLSKVTGDEIGSRDIRIQFPKIVKHQLHFIYDDINYSWNFREEKLQTHPGPVKRSERKRNSISPDGKKEIIITNYNLWLKDLEDQSLKQLTFDGVADFGYATNNAGWTRSDDPVLLWSPDSKKITTFQHDGRGVGEMHMVSTNVGHPNLESWKYPLPGDSLIFRIHRLVINCESGKIMRLQMPPDMHRSSVTDHIALRGGRLADAEWSDDGRFLSFVSNSRDHKEAILRIADIETGEVWDVLEEREETFFESGYRMSNWRFLKESDEIIWYSQRSDWGHLYLYDLTTGSLKNQITSGEWNVAQVLHVDKDNRLIYFYGVGREEGDPYYQYLYRVDFDGNQLELLTPEPANHLIDFSPGRDFFIDSYSTPQDPPVMNLRESGGNKIAELARADVQELKNSGWKPPVSIKVKARDEKTDLYGLMFLPYDFDSLKKYPIINYIYPGPQAGSVGSRSFSAARRDNQALADLGFIVVAIDAMGTPLRSKSFHAAYYGNMGDNGLPDQVNAMRQLAERHSWIDLERTGIYGHSGGGFASTDAILRYPDFFKVAVSGAGNHDNRNYEDDWGEKWQGLLVENPDGSTNYDNQANQLLAENLKGKLLLTHGTMDGNVPVYNTLLVADRLIEANKDFDMILFPNRGHGYGNEPYMMRKRWDYFVRHLLGAEPPKEFKFGMQIERP